MSQEHTQRRLYSTAAKGRDDKQLHPKVEMIGDCIDESASHDKKDSR